jgi:hypothetical protein
VARCGRCCHGDRGKRPDRRTFGPATDAIQDYRDTLVAVEALLIAQRKKAGHSDRANEGVIKNSGRVSKGEAKRRTKRADAVERNPALATKLTTGDLSTEKVDLLADASAKTEGAAATDAALIDEVCNANPDQAKAIVRKFVDDHTDQGDRNSRYAWQRKRRKVYRTTTSSGMSALILEGDDESIDAVLGTIRRRADRLYATDGGRDVSAESHDRTHDQRMFDAAIGHATDTAAKDNNEQPSVASASPKNRPSERPVMVFTGKLSDITTDTDTIRDWQGELIGTGRLPTAVAEYYRCISDTAAQLTSDVGEVLWQGRTKRTVTRGQWLALVVRDGGCVLCEAHHTECEAHHLMPWNAPAKGETNIDELALVCVDCHHRIHDNNQTLFFDTKIRKWRLRAAKPEETAPMGRRPQPLAKAVFAKSSEPSGSRPADSKASVKAT